MTIQITRGPRGDRSPIISFVGQDSDEQQAADRFSFVQTITPQVNTTNPDAVDIVDTVASINNNAGTYILFNVDYADWLDREGNPFASALDVVTYIQDQTGGAVTILEERTSLPVALTTSIGVTVNTPFEFDITHEGGSGYFWDRNGFPSTLSVNPLDRRKISGIMTQTGTYALQCEVANINGITTTSVYVVVV